MKTPHSQTRAVSARSGRRSKAVPEGEGAQRTLKLTLEYDGTGYAGWQRQNDQITVQAVVEAAVGRLIGRPHAIVGAGRTDAGVHAYGQVAHFRTTSRLGLRAFQGGLNHFLPEDVRVVGVEEAAPDFHARFCARGKVYRYLVFQRECHCPVGRTYMHFIPYAVSMKAMREAARQMVGTHDFSAFCVHSGLHREKNHVRQVTGIDIVRSGRLIEFTVTGTGFLYRMVRSIVGTLLDVGRGRIEDPDRVTRILQDGLRAGAGATVPAHGLYLVKVLYA